MTLINFLAAAFCIGCFTAFIITLARKLGVLENLQLHAPNETLEKLFGCDFCLSFWLGCAAAIVASLIFANSWLLLAPFVSTALSRFLI